MRPAASFTCDITAFGAVGDNSTDCTAAIQGALDDTTCTTIVVPAPGQFLSKSISLEQASGKSLVINSGAALVVWRNITSYGKGDFLTAGQGLLRNFSLTGGGSIVGGGAAWWPYGHSIFRPRILGAINVSGLTVSNLTFIDSPFWNMCVPVCCEVRRGRQYRPHCMWTFGFMQGASR